MKRKKEIRRVIFLGAVGIALFMTLPRLVIIANLKSKTFPGANTITWWDIGQKFQYSLVVALLFLWVNLSRRKIITIAGRIDMTRFSSRFAINLILFFVVRFLTLKLKLYTPGVMASKKVAAFMFNTTLVLEICFCILAAEIYRLLASNQLARLNNEMLQKVNAETRFEVLKNQVNPHFLFNSLNTIIAMIGKDPAAARNFVINMSHVYRHVLKSAGQPVVRLAEEMEVATAYVDMLRERHRNSLKVDIDVGNNHLSDLLPPMSIQILLENVIKHNVVSARMPLTVTIYTEKRSLVVSNRIQERKVKEASTGTGLYNLHQRYIYLCNRGIAISRSNGVFQVSLPLLERKHGDVIYESQG
jgi:uncharacterized membrane protein (DUF485 family)